MEQNSSEFNILYDKEYIEIEYGQFKLNRKIAIFDLDKTLIKNKSNENYFIDKDDWEFIHNHIPLELRELNHNNYSVFIITNQKGLYDKKKEWLIRLNIILDSINIPIKVLVAIHNNIYRKPYPGFFDLIKLSYYNQNKKIIMNESFFVGDACGRDAVFHKNGIGNFEKIHEKYHSDCDLKFALNCKLKFKTPESFLAHMDYNYDNVHFLKKINLNYINPIILPSNNKEVIIVIGLPGSGKSHFVNNLIKNDFNNYLVTNLNFDVDINKTKDYITNNILNNSIIIDNYNLKNDSRKRLVDFLTMNSIEIRYIIMDTPTEICLHNLNYKFYKNAFSKEKVKIPQNIYYFKQNEINIETNINSIYNIKFTLFDYNDDYFLFI